MEPTTTPFRLNMSPNMTPSYSTSEKILTAFRLSRKAIWRQDFTWCNRTPGLLLEEKPLTKRPPFMPATHSITSSQLDSSVGRAQHRYRRNHRFESRSSLNFFTATYFKVAYSNCNDSSSIDIVQIQNISHILLQHLTFFDVLSRFSLLSTKLVTPFQNWALFETLLIKNKRCKA